MSDSDDHHFIKPSFERKKEKKKKKKKASCEEAEEVVEMASDASLSSAAGRKRLRRATDDDESSDSCATETDTGSVAATRKPAASKKIRAKESPVKVSPGPSEKLRAENNASAPAKTVSVATPSVKPAPNTPATMTSYSCEQYARKASSLVDEVLKYCLDERNKIGKSQTAFVMERVSGLNKIATFLAVRNNYLTGSLDSLKAASVHSAQAARAPGPIPAAAPPTTTGTLSYASMAGKNLPAQRRGAAGAPHPTTAPPTASPTTTISPLLAPNGVLSSKPRAFTENVIEAARSAPMRHCVRITPLNPADGDSSVTKTKLLKSIDFKKCQIGIKSIRPTRDGGILVETPNARDLKTFIDNPTLAKAGLKVASPQSELPRIVVRDIPKDLEAQDIAEHIRAQNLQPSPVIDKATVRPLFKVGRKDKEGNDWVIEVSNSIREALLPRERIFVSYMHCRVADYLVATRCYKCQKYGHVDKHCKSAETVCSYCARTGHANKECPNREKTPSCSNCRARHLPHNHSAGNRNCPSRSSALIEKASRINYR